MSRIAVTPDQFDAFGDLLKYLRRRTGLTQRELSIAVGYSDTQISRLEQNQRVPDAATLTALFIPALHLEREPEWAARLLQLAEQVRRGNVPPPADAVAASSVPKHNLPVQLTSFIGRQTEIAEISRLFDNNRLVTLIGSGGAGKTRLSLQVAAGLLPSFPNGVWFVELAPLADPALVAQIMATTLGLRMEGGRPALEAGSGYVVSDR